MTKHMEIKNSVFAKLQEIKGDRSYSDVIDSLLDKTKGICESIPVQATELEQKKDFNCDNSPGVRNNEIFENKE